MLFLLRFTDKPDTQLIRDQYYKAHAAWLDANAASVLVAGVLKPEPDAPHVAAIWIVRAPDRAAALALADTDPFWINGLRATREIYFYKVRSALAAFTEA